MINLYCVKATIEDSKEPTGFRAIWQFNAIPATSKVQAIRECKWTMKKLVGTIPRFKWIAELEWEDNLAVN